MHILWNDQIVERDEVKIDIEDRGYQYGDGLYEVVRVYNGHLFMLEEHLNRLWDGAEKIRMTLPFTKDELAANLQKLVALEGIPEGKLYFQVTRGIDSPRNHALPDPKKVTGVLTANITACERPVKKMQEGITVAVVPDTRWLHCDIKSLSLMGNILSLDEARRQGFDDAVLIRDDKVTEASAANFWAVKDGTVYTHPDGNLILPGITKRKILELARELNIPVKEEAIFEEELFTADECFVSGSVTEIVPVVKINEHIVGSGKPGKITQQLINAYIASVDQVCAVAE
ncbi:D-amino-acid transaminase [Enterococcus sp. DIV0242_7C1]|uniref:D-alanine aminotransferase n=1 Tax=Candidatus Enterococcus dunnyi TaxID=1834192 RepID=A0A200J860_9ENTE|nr:MULTISPECIES: D-amino-acid transaminase [unclassified Enterococcus]MBO0471644.1 D-amino-acid transaminase [Enterococcus sp. DIV0242_7C1]OUZ32807.1 D-amino-acid transaminase [Enterococcus sp. 9D6_DIV0238]